MIECRGNVRSNGDRLIREHGSTDGQRWKCDRYDGNAIDMMEMR